ncbi:hypothetical protein [Chitinophaga tropicalis]|uniref:Uncharacterized protein n=1 Tax=Chitinophaga tropicalis TaxID=2683588 RepID=A0A7K1U889_9BACT|nr:hypothetical protein [Chitinophaga tropicalis]MVT10490.1 hypothetical protein [Chitinophaga tropicalis]
MKPLRFIPVVLGMLLLGASCVPPRHGPPRPPKPPRPPHGAIQFRVPESSFHQQVIAFNR